MSFKDNKYFKDLVISEITQYKLNPTSFTEAKIRSIFSRAYYTIFLHCRDELELEYNDELSIHQTVKSNIKNLEINQLFHEHHKTRKKMDYNNLSIDLTSTGKLVKDLDSIRRDMNRILSLKKEDLIK